MPMTQNGSNNSANIETYNDYGNVTNGIVILSELEMNVLMNTYVSVYNQFNSNELKGRLLLQ